MLISVVYVTPPYFNSLFSCVYIFHVFFSRCYVLVVFNIETQVVNFRGVFGESDCNQDYWEFDVVWNQDAWESDYGVWSAGLD